MPAANTLPVCAFRLAQHVEIHVVAVLFNGTFHTTNMQHCTNHYTYRGY